MSVFTGAVGQSLRAKFPNFEVWTASLHDEPIQELFSSDEDKQKCVYLTADSEHTLDKLEPGTNYIVGGIVDKNRYSNFEFFV